MIEAEGGDAKTSALAISLARDAYERNKVRLVDGDLTGCSHMLATRKGLFAIAPGHVRRVAYGLFYGLTIAPDAIFVFEACDLPRTSTPRGRIVKLALAGNHIVSAAIVTRGLDTGCHQMDLIDGRLVLLDTYDQSVLAFDLDGRPAARFHPLPRASRHAHDGDYAHVNSLLAIDGHVLLVLHNGTLPSRRPSEVAVCDAEWRVVRRVTLDGEACHNIVVLEDGSWLVCGSRAGELIGSNGLRVAISPGMMTRGLSVDEDSIVVGASPFTAHEARLSSEGMVVFLDRSYRRRSTLPVPGAPTDIRRIDGRDRGLSMFHGVSRRDP